MQCRSSCRQCTRRESLQGRVTRAGKGVSFGSERIARDCRRQSYLVDVDDGLPEVVLLLVVVTHTDLTEVTGVVPEGWNRLLVRCGTQSQEESATTHLSMLVRW